jgi:hypothetical protein
MDIQSATLGWHVYQTTAGRQVNECPCPIAVCRRLRHVQLIRRYYGCSTVSQSQSCPLHDLSPVTHLRRAVQIHSYARPCYIMLLQLPAHLCWPALWIYAWHIDALTVPPLARPFPGWLMWIMCDTDAFMVSSEASMQLQLWQDLACPLCSCCDVCSGSLADCICCRLSGHDHVKHLRSNSLGVPPATPAYCCLMPQWVYGAYAALQPSSS